MKKDEGGADGFSGPTLGDRAAWDTGSPDHECDCPGPPPRFHLPPPPRPFFLLASDCAENSTSRLDACEAVPVIDAEYHYSPAVPSLVIILTVAAVVAVFLLVGTFLVFLKRRKMLSLFPRKSSPPHNLRDAASSNGVIYEDLTNLRPRMLSSQCSPGQTTLPSIEMIDVAPYPEHVVFAPVLMCSTSPMQDCLAARDLFNPVYEELSNGSVEAGESDSEGVPPVGASEDEFAEDELSFGGEAEVRRPGDANVVEEYAVGAVGDDACRDAESSDSDDKCKFLENSARDSTSSSVHWDKKKRGNRGSYLGGVARGAKVSERKKVWRNKARPPLPALPADSNEFHEGFLLKRIFQIYPDVTGMGLQHSCSPAKGALSEVSSAGGVVYESLDALAGTHVSRPKPEIFCSSGQLQGFTKNQSQDSSLGSDSGYSNNTSGGKSFSRVRKEYRLSNHSENIVLS